MADEQDQVYALDAGGNKIATLTTAQILEAIAEAIETGQVPSELKAFIDAIQEQNKGNSLKFWLGTQAEFLALESTSDDIIYFINDSTNLRDLSNALAQLEEKLESGDFVVEKANNATNADTAKQAIEFAGRWIYNGTGLSIDVNGETAVYDWSENLSLKEGYYYIAKFKYKTANNFVKYGAAGGFANGIERSASGGDNFVAVDFNMYGIKVSCDTKYSNNKYILELDATLGTLYQSMELISLYEAGTLVPSV